MQLKLTYLVYLLPFPLSASRVAAQDPEAIWTQLTPNSNLTWTPCYTDGLQCARYQVPLDYKHPNGPQAAIAMLKAPSSLNPDDKAYRGPVLLNPGGPGGSGVDFVLDIGPLARQVLGPEYDIIGFDPRGVARTTPSLRIFRTEAEASTFTLQTNDDPFLGSTPGAVGRTLARYQAFGSIAEARAGDVAPYISTALVARDMLSIVKAHGQDKLLYLGNSWGSLLGITFASIFPQNVGRIAVDGILNASDYYSTNWKTNLVDADEAMYAFYQACAQAGPQACAIHDKSPKAIKARVDRLLERLKVQPIAASVGSGSLDYGIVDFGLLQGNLFTLLYGPYAIAANFASALAALENGNAGLFWQLLEATGSVAECSAGNDKERPQLDVETYTPIICTDGEPVRDSLEELQKWYEGNARTSSFAGTLTNRVRCAGWKVRPVERFSGRVGSNTSFPLLFLSNRLDPITPLPNAKSMSKLFPGSAVLVQDAIGHTTFSATSMCTLGALSAYFRDGTLPKDGTVCNIEEEMLPVTNGTTKGRRRDFNDNEETYREFVRKVQLWSKRTGY